MLSVEELTEKILYWLSSDQRVRALAEKLLHRFEETVGDLPASEKHHHSEPGGLYRHSLEVALKALEEFEGDIIMEPRSDGSIDSFRSSRNRPRWTQSQHPIRFFIFEDLPTRHQLPTALDTRAELACTCPQDMS